MTRSRRARKRRNTALIIATVLLLIAAVGAVVLVNMLFKNQKPAWEGGYSIHISEVMTDNDDCPDPHGALCDWVEIANTSARPAELGGYGLSDQEGKMKYIFPAGTSVPANGFLVVWCSSDLEGNYAPFALKKDYPPTSPPPATPTTPPDGRRTWLPGPRRAAASCF